MVCSLAYVLPLCPPSIKSSLWPSIAHDTSCISLYKSFQKLYFTLDDDPTGGGREKDGVARL